MELFRFIILLYLASPCKAGPLVGAIIEGIGAVVGEAAAAAVAGSGLASAFGVGASAIWYGGFVVVDGALYYGTAAAGIGALAGGAAGAAELAKSIKSKDKPVTDAAMSKSVVAHMSASLHSASEQSVASVKSVSKQSEVSVKSVASVHSHESKQSVESVKSASKHSVESAKSASKESVASVESVSKASVASVKSEKTAKTHASPAPSRQPPKSPASNIDPQVTHRILSKSLYTALSKDSAVTSHSAVVTVTAPTSSIVSIPATPVSSLPAGQRPSEVPAGVPDYNFRMCQVDIIKMGQANENLTFDQPAAQSIRVGNIPSTCMVLATVLLGNPDLGPHPHAMGSATLQWDDIHTDTMNLIRQGFGLKPQ